MQNNEVKRSVKDQHLPEAGFHSVPGIHFDEK